MNSAERPSVRPMRRGHFIAQVIDRAIAADPDLTLTGLGHRLGGWPEETMRGYRDGNSSPSYDRVVGACRRSTTPAPVVLDLALTLVGARAAVELVDRSDVPAGTRPADVVKELIHALSGFDALLQDAYVRTGDGDVSADDAAAISAAGDGVVRLIKRAVRFSNHCAAGRSR